jgi:hypothetical protein
MTARRFTLRRYDDPTGISGKGDVAEGVRFSLTPHERSQGIAPEDAAAALRWLTEWPTTVVFHDRGMAGVEALHGHGGATRIIWHDPPDDETPRTHFDYEGAMADLAVLVEHCRTVVDDPSLRVGREGHMRDSVAALARHLELNHPPAGTP